jgi:carbamoyltransferase
VIVMETRDPVVLGVCAFTHDSAAALMVGGELVGFVEEERLSGAKHTSAFPSLAVDWLLSEAGLSAGQVQHVGYNFQPRLYLPSVARSVALLADPASRRRAPARAASFAKVSLRTARRLRNLAERFPNARVRAVAHHLAHQRYAFDASGFADAAVLVADSLGESATTSIAEGILGSDGRTRIQQLWQQADPASLGYVYGAVTEHLGWRRGDEEGTVMALAATGDAHRFGHVFTDGIRLTAEGFRLDPGVFPVRVLASRYARLGPRFTQLTCPPRAAGAPVEQTHADLAAALQERTEQVMLHLALLAREKTGATRLCVGGGVATNCVAVGKIIEAGLFDEVAVPPAPGDAGTAIGAAAALHDSVSSLPPRRIARSCYLGPKYPLTAPDTSAWPELHARPMDADVIAQLADALSAGQIVGLFRGRAEAGPRALGNRSILASPLQPGVVARLNDTVKFREPFRPFAPMVPVEQAKDYFTLGQDAPFMSMASGVTDQARDNVPAVVHANGTSRLQTVARADNAFVHALLTAFGERTGVPVLINTSLNVKGKPMCGTPAMAIECLASSGLDALMLEGWWISK